MGAPRLESTTDLSDRKRAFQIAAIRWLQKTREEAVRDEETLERMTHYGALSALTDIEIDELVDDLNNG